MKFVLKSAIVALALASTACDKGTSGDPSTIGRSELQPPTGLTTVTWDKKIELRWKGANAEDDFKGYHVFAVAKKISEVGTPAYPKNLTVDLKTGSIPRCVDNNAVFKTFGFNDIKTACEGDAEKPATGTTGAGLVEEPAADAPAEKLENTVKCAENTSGDTSISLPEAAATLGDVVCTVSALTDGTALANGTTYTFFVAAVAGDEKNNISWTSNFVQDTPAESLYQSDFSVAGDGKMYIFPEAKIVARTAIVAADLTPVACDTKACSILSPGNDLGTPGIYIGRLGNATSYPQRMFLSVPTGGKIKVLQRGPQVFDPMDNSFQNSIPGDAAADTTYSAGTVYPIYGNQVFDLQVTSGTSTNYGKIVIGQPKLETAATSNSTITMPIAIIMQPQVGSFDYLTGDRDQDF